MLKKLFIFLIFSVFVLSCGSGNDNNSSNSWEDFGLAGLSDVTSADNTVVSSSWRSIGAYWENADIDDHSAMKAEIKRSLNASGASVTNEKDYSNTSPEERKGWLWEYTYKGNRYRMTLILVIDAQTINGSYHNANSMGLEIIKTGDA